MLCSVAGDVDRIVEAVGRKGVDRHKDKAPASAEIASGDFQRGCTLLGIEPFRQRPVENGRADLLPNLSENFSGLSLDNQEQSGAENLRQFERRSKSTVDVHVDPRQRPALAVDITSASEVQPAMA